MPAAIRPSVRGDPHPHSSPRSIAKVIATIPATTVAIPGRSMCRGAESSRDSAIARRAITIASSANGTLIANTDLQPNASVSAPPANGPIAVAIAPRP